MPHQNTPSKTRGKASNDDGVTLDLPPRERLRVRHHPDLHTVDLRVMQDVTGSGAWMVSRDGVVIPVGTLDDLIDALKKIAATAKRRAA